MKGKLTFHSIISTMMVHGLYMCFSNIFEQNPKFCFKLKHTE
jgi:hypothetical protein